MVKTVLWPILRTTQPFSATIMERFMEKIMEKIMEKKGTS